MELQEFGRYHLPALETDEVRYNVQIAVLAAAMGQGLDAATLDAGRTGALCDALAGTRHPARRARPRRVRGVGRPDAGHRLHGRRWQQLIHAQEEQGVLIAAQRKPRSQENRGFSDQCLRGARYVRNVENSPGSKRIKPRIKRRILSTPDRL